ncbi:hypothetical protein T4D_2750 [Trichinella pseudospiralis]|uniref:Uncharacterized protein n=1 Tax=Trichinella pseudospiralis TaxID=6337 RepID=A0A0V1F4T8_TRIPS|nr:hypothetical protein T4D_2750 [Trichinella pseudospiralis]
METDMSLFLFVLLLLTFRCISMLKMKNNLATPSAPHYFYFNCCFNIKTFSYCSEDFNFVYSSHGLDLFICTQQVMEDYDTSICEVMCNKSTVGRSAWPEVLYIIEARNRVRWRNEGFQCVLAMPRAMLQAFFRKFRIFQNFSPRRRPQATPQGIKKFAYALRLCQWHLIAQYLPPGYANFAYANFFVPSGYAWGVA